MPTVRTIMTDALREIGAVGVADTVSPADGQIALLRFQNQIDSWNADFVTLALQLQTPITWPSATSTQTIGPGGNVAIQRPVWIDALNYVIPGTSPAVESPMGPMDRDSYANKSIKSLPSALPTEFFYQTSLTDLFGTLFIWPQPSQSLTLMLYTPLAVGVPATLDTVMTGPPGYAEAFMYQLALRLCTPFGKPVPPLLPTLATDAYARMKRPNLMPGVLGMDPALVPTAGGYNILTDNANAPSAR